eukprot:scaffold2385_cov126-Isochrysis_galbana.AAC.9
MVTGVTGSRTTSTYILLLSTFHAFARLLSFINLTIVTLLSYCYFVRFVVCLLPASGETYPNFYGELSQRRCRISDQTHWLCLSTLVVCTFVRCTLVQLGGSVTLLLHGAQGLTVLCSCLRN